MDNLQPRTKDILDNRNEPSLTASKTILHPKKLKMCKSGRETSIIISF